MQRKSVRAILTLLVVLLTVTVLGAHPVSEMTVLPEEVQVQILFTSDIHGAIVDSQYSSGDAATISGTGLSRLSTVLKERRELYPNSITLDNGDTIQGTPFTYYYAFFRNDVEDPTMKALGLLDYDCWNWGNHEFNYGMTILNKQVADAESEGIEVITANFIKSGSDSYEPYCSAYITRTYDGVKVGVIGMDTPNIPTWDKAANWEGIDFRTFVDCWNHYADILKNEEGCDIVIVACHSGRGTSGGNLVDADEIEGYNGDGLYYEDSYENQIACLIENSRGIDLVLGGHTHEKGTYSFRDLDGKEVPVLHCGTKAQALGAALITYSNVEGKITDITLDVIDTSKSDVDEEFLAAMSTYETEVWDNYLNAVIGYAEKEFPAPGNMTEPNAFLDLINRVQLDAIPEEIGAQMSISAPLNSSTGAVIPEGDIKLGLLFQLYKYENWLYCIDMTGSEIKAWLEFAATKYEVSDGVIVRGGGMYCDTLYGEGVSYEVYLGNEEGDRVRNITYLGEPLDMDGHYRVVINNYRFTGGGNYMKAVSDYLDAPSFAGDESRVLYSTQYDMEQGEDLGQVRNLLSAYIQKVGVITPEVTGSFAVYTSASDN